MDRGLVEGDSSQRIHGMYVVDFFQTGKWELFWECLVYILSEQ